MPMVLMTVCDPENPGTTYDLTLTVKLGLIVAGNSPGAWDSAIWDGSLWGFSETFEDVSDYVETVTVNRSFARSLRIWSAGSISISLCNIDGRFSPDNLDGPYVVGGISSIRPGCGVLVTVEYRGVTYPVFKGFATEWADSWIGIHGAGTGGARSVVSGTDEWARIAKAPGLTGGGSVGAGDNLAERLKRILDQSGSTCPRDIDVGYTTFQATDLSSSPSEEIEITFDSEGGAFYLGADGTFVGRDKYSLVEDSRSVDTQLILSDSGAAGTVQWGSIDVAPLGDSTIINKATYMIVGGTPQTYYDPESLSLYGPREDKSPNIDRLLADSDSMAYSLAQWMVAVYKDPEASVRSVTLGAQCGDPDVVIPAVFGTQLRDLVQVIRTPPGGFTLTRYCFVSGISLNITRGSQIAVFHLASATRYVEFADSRWDVALWDYARWFP